MIKKILLVGVILMSTSIFAGATKWYDFEIVNDTPILDVEIAGVPAKAALSTGSTSVFINVDFLKKNNIKYFKGKNISVSGLYGKPRKDRLVRGVDIEVLGLPFRLNASGPEYGESYYDIQLGYSFLKSYIFQIDYQKSKIRALTRDSVDMNEIANIKTFSTDQKKGLIVVTELENGNNLRLKLTTAISTGILLEHSFVEEQGWLEKYSVSEVKNDPNHSTLTLPKLHIGPYILADVIVTFPSKPINSSISAKTGASETGTRISKNENYKGLLGYDVLKHFTITLDAKTSKMHLYAE